MPTKTPFFKEFGPLLFGRPARNIFQKLKKIDAIEELYELFGHMFPERLLEPTDGGANSRERIFSQRVTFWAFVAQVLSPGTSCRETVRRVKAWWKQGGGLDCEMSDRDSAYCQARARLDPQALELIAQHLCWRLEGNVLKHERWLNGRRVKIVDGTGVSMPDTVANQAVWPQPTSQQPGCGFPVMKLLGIFSLSSGALLESVTGNLHDHDSILFRDLWGKLKKGDVLLADRAFCSYGTMAALQKRGIDSVMRLHQMRRADFRSGKALGDGDRLIVWKKPAQRTEVWTEEEFAALPDTLTLRMIRLRVANPGFRTRAVVLVTTLLNATTYSADALRELYGKRWTVELHFHQIKALLEMDVLRCKSPELIELEVAMHRIAYNLVRTLMQRSAHLHDVPLPRISFKGALDTLRHWAQPIAAASNRPRRQDQLIDEMLAIIARDIVPERPGRSEPRAKKRRPRNYQLLTKPRHQIGNLPRRNRPNKRRSRTCLS
jgi:Transposase DDE domain